MQKRSQLAELVLWIGYLQWHIRTRGNKAVAEPVVHDYGNIEHRDAVLAWDDTDLAYDADGQLLSRWDGKTFKTHPVTGALVPDEAALVPQWKYIKPAQAKWPKADFIVGNPPFIGASTMRAALGDGYVEALRGVWKEVPESADFVMHWWSRAAALVVSGAARSFGLITTNSLRQTFNRRVVQAAFDQGVALTFAIPDHPWVDSANGAAVRIAMTVGANSFSSRTSASPSSSRRVLSPLRVLPPSVRAEPVEAIPARLLTVTHETTGEFGEVTVTLLENSGRIHADLSVGANVASAVALQANANVSSPGVKLHGAGFIVTPEEAADLLPLPPGEGWGEGQPDRRIIREYRNGRDLTDAPREVKVIDLFGLASEQVRSQFPAVYQRLLERVKPERDQNNRASYRDNWWIHGEPRRVMRNQLAGLTRYIATPVTSKHRTFQFLAASILADDALICIASDSAFELGVLSSNLHVVWALATGGTLENRPRYNNSRCFETFPFPDEDTGLTPALRDRIAQLAEQIDAHRKRQQAAHTGLTLTGMYNVLEALRAERELTAKEKTIHTQGLVGVLKELHDELDAAVLQAYNWGDLTQTLRQAQGERGSSSDLLTRLVALNTQRATEEKTGHIRWLRPEFQNPQVAAAAAAADQSLLNQELLTQASPGLQADLALNVPPPVGPTAASLPTWPGTLPEQVRAVAHVLSTAPAAMPLTALEASFKGKGPWKKGLPRILETLEALGRARRLIGEATDAGVLWQA